MSFREPTFTDIVATQVTHLSHDDSNINTFLLAENSLAQFSSDFNRLKETYQTDLETPIRQSVRDFKTTKSSYVRYERFQQLYVAFEACFQHNRVFVQRVFVLIGKVLYYYSSFRSSYVQLWNATKAQWDASRTILYGQINSLKNDLDKTPVTRADLDLLIKTIQATEVVKLSSLTIRLPLEEFDYYAHTSSELQSNRIELEKAQKEILRLQSINEYCVNLLQEQSLYFPRTLGNFGKAYCKSHNIEDSGVVKTIGGYNTDVDTRNTEIVEAVSKLKGFHEEYYKLQDELLTLILETFSKTNVNMKDIVGGFRQMWNAVDQTIKNYENNHQIQEKFDEDFNKAFKDLVDHYVPLKTYFLKYMEHKKEHMRMKTLLLSLTKLVNRQRPKNDFETQKEIYESLLSISSKIHLWYG